MGTWGMGPFDNDTAADWCGDLHDAEPKRRPHVVREALTAVVDADGYLRRARGDVALAAAAIVASQRPDGPKITSPYAPDFLVAGDASLTLPDDFALLALRALDRIVSDDSEWRELWEDDLAAILAQLEPLRAALGR